MNVSLPKRLLIYWLLLLGGSLSAYAQETVQVFTYQNQTLSYTFLSQPNDPNVISGPANGTFTLTEAGFNRTINYTPNEDFVGNDEMLIGVWNSPFSYTSLTLQIEVAPSKVEAIPDFAATPVNQSVVIPALQNDFSSNGVLILKNIPLANNGSAYIDTGSGEIIFTPAPDFEGLAYLNYIVCDDIGTCDNGTVSVFVLDASTNQPDTMVIFTHKNNPQSVLIPAEYVLLGLPDNGEYDDSGDIPTYTPDTDFTGTDYIFFQYGGVAKWVQINVLDIEQNTLGVEDRVYMTPYEVEREINVLANDVLGVSASCFSLVGSPFYGTVEFVPGQDPKGVVRYTPAPGFVGVDQFQYASCQPGGTGETELTSVYVFISNFEPSASRYYMSTPKLTPLVVGYSVPIADFNFEVVAQGDLGEVVFLPGEVDTTIYGQHITGYNLILYLPNSNVNSGVDEFEIRYCLWIGNACQYEMTVKIEVDILDIGDGSAPMCIGDCVWSGDTNFDGVVNMEDLLPIGLCMGEVGIPRADANPNLWYGKYGEDWEDPFGGLGIDLKHLDTDGDSLITALDTLAISNFYGNTHSMTAALVPHYDFQILLDGPLFVNPGDLVELTLELGTEQAPAQDVYGFTFPFLYNTDFIVPASIELDFVSNSWLTYNSPVLHMDRNDLEGRVEAGFTRTNGISASGYGMVGTVRFIVSEDLAGLRPGEESLHTRVGGGMSALMNGSGRTQGVYIPEWEMQILLDEAADLDKLNPDLLIVYPNPTNLDYVNIHLNGQQEFQRIIVSDQMGHQLLDLDHLMSSRAGIPVYQLPNGIYTVSVFTAEGVINKQFSVFRD